MMKPGTGGRYPMHLFNDPTRKYHERLFQVNFGG